MFEAQNSRLHDIFVDTAEASALALLIGRCRLPAQKADLSARRTCSKVAQQDQIRGYGSGHVVEVKGEGTAENAAETDVAARAGSCLSATTSYPCA